MFYKNLILKCKYIENIPELCKILLFSVIFFSEYQFKNFVIQNKTVYLCPTKKHFTKLITINDLVITIIK
jgi:hypothetical protein